NCLAMNFSITASPKCVSSARRVGKLDGHDSPEPVEFIAVARYQAIPCLLNLPDTLMRPIYFEMCTPGQPQIQIESAARQIVAAPVGDDQLAAGAQDPSYFVQGRDRPANVMKHVAGDDDIELLRR